LAESTGEIQLKLKINRSNFNSFVTFSKTALSSTLVEPNLYYRESVSKKNDNNAETGIEGGSA
jgi:hypothetical protein